MKKLSISTAFITICLIAFHADSEEESSSPAEEVVITASRREVLLRDTADIVQVIDRAQIDEMNASSTGELVEYATGAARSTGTGSGLPDRSVISINGLPPNYTLVLVDGIPLLTDHMHTGQNIDFIPPSNIERIEIVRGAASAQYGADAIGGIINIITRKSTDQKQWNLGIAAGSYNTFEGNVSLLVPAGEHVRISSFASWEQSDGLPLKAPAHRIDNTGYERLNLLNRVDATLGDSTELFAWLNLVDYSMDWRGSSVDSLLVTPVISFTHELTPSLDLDAKVSYSDWDADVNEEKNHLLKQEADLKWEVGETHTLMTGQEYRRNEFERIAVTAPDQTAHAFFIQDEWIANEYIVLMSAVRYDKVEDIEAAVSPKISVMIAPSERFRVRASVGRGFHAPTLQELYEEGYGHGGTAYRFGNPDLDPEYSTTYTAGIEGKPFESLMLMVYGFYSDLDDMIVPVYEGAWDKDPTIDVWRRTNISSAQVYGTEASARLNIGNTLTLEGGYTYTENEDKDTGRQLPYSPGSSIYGKISGTRRLTAKYTAKAFIGIRTGMNREAWNWTPVTDAGRDNSDGLTTRLDDYTKLDAGLTVCIADKYDAFIKVENILGEDIESLDDSYTVLDGEPFVRVGLNYRFPVQP